MTLPASGAISFNAINVELGVAGTTQASLGQTSYRNLAGVASGQISMSNFYGKANQFAFTISSNQTNANLRTLAVNAGWNQSSKVVATINAGVYVSSNSTGTPALTVNGSFPGGVELVNNGLIIGMGGNGGRGRGTPDGASGSSGGIALSVAVGMSLRNNGTIGGGGGGGGGGGTLYYQFDGGKSGTQFGEVGGGGGGGGRSANAANSSGGVGGTVRAGLGEPLPGSPGAAGTVSASGAGGAGGYRDGGIYGGAGGAGGAWGAAGAAGANVYFYGYAATGTGIGLGGGAAGAAITGNGNITYLATGTRLGAIS